MTRLPTLCQLNYDRDIPTSTRPKVRTASTQQRPTTAEQASTTCKGVDFPQLLAYEKHIETTPYHYSSASFPPPKEDDHPPRQDSQSYRDTVGQLCSHERGATADSSYSLPVLRSRGGVETSHTMNAERLKEPTWNPSINAWVSDTPTCRHAYFNITGPLNLNNRGVFHFVREFERIHKLPCERFEEHMHHTRFHRHIRKKTKKIIEKPEFWHWKGRTKPIVPKFTKPKPPQQEYSSPSSPCLRAYSTHGRICITLPVTTPSSPVNSCVGSCRSDAPDFSAHSFFSELSSLSPFSSTCNPVSPPESRVSDNSVTTAESGIVSCDSFSSMAIPKSSPTGLSYLPAAPRLPSGLPWEGEDGWGSDISSFHSEPALVQWPAGKTIHYCKIIVERPILLEELNVFTRGWNTWSVPPDNLPVPDNIPASDNVPVLIPDRLLFKQTLQSMSNEDGQTLAIEQRLTIEQTLVHPQTLVSSDMVKVDDVDRVTIQQAPLLHKLPQLPPAPSPRAETPIVRTSQIISPESKIPQPKEMQQPRKKKELRKKKKVPTATLR